MRSSRPTTPITQPIEKQQSSRPTAPITRPTAREQSLISIDVDHHDSNVSQQSRDIRDKQLLEMFKKQSKQLRALYEMQKTTASKVTWIQNQIKKQNETKSKELSDKVFGVSNFISK